MINANHSTPRKKPSLSFPLGEHKRFHNKCVTQSYHDEINSRPPSQVLPYLYIGSAENSADEALLRQLGVTAILNVSYNSPEHFGTSFEYKKIRVLDDHHADLLSQLHSAIEFIGEYYYYRYIVKTFCNLSHNIVVSAFFYGTMAAIE